MLRKDLGNWEKSELISPSSLQWKHTMAEVEKRKCMERKQPERTAVFFQGFSRKKVDICTWQKMKHHFLEWAKCHINRWQKCRHAREQDYELMHGHIFLSRNVETAALWELFWLLNLQNHVIISLASSLLHMDIDAISWKTFLLSVFLITTQTLYILIFIWMKEKLSFAVTLIFLICIILKYLSKHHTLGFYLYTGLFYMCINWFVRYFGVKNYFKTIIFYLYVFGYKLFLKNIRGKIKRWLAELVHGSFFVPRVLGTLAQLPGSVWPGLACDLQTSDDDG